jgi:hypothetical protein
LRRIAAQSRDSQILSNELLAVHAAAITQSDDGWVGTSLLLMTNGEWLLYQNDCVKEPNHLHDLFLAQGSDGKWYYSTFYFCPRMIVVRSRMFAENDHGSIAAFTRTYFVHEFDGKSDECLNLTYPVKK